MPPVITLLLAATPPTAWEQVRKIPTQTWINLGICLLALIIIIRVWRGLKQFNEYAPYFAATLAASMIFFYWVYNRTEPRFLTPVVDKLAPLLPTRSKQEQDLERLRRSREG